MTLQGNSGGDECGLDLGWKTYKPCKVRLSCRKTGGGGNFPDFKRFQPFQFLSS